MKKIFCLTIIVLLTVIGRSAIAQDQTFFISLHSVQVQLNYDSTLVKVYYTNDADKPDTLIVKYGKGEKSSYFASQMKIIPPHDDGTIDFIIPTEESKPIELSVSSWGGTVGKNSDASSMKINRK